MSTAADRAEIIDRNFCDAISALPPSSNRAVPAAQLAPPARLDAQLALALFDAQLGSRHLDLASRRLRITGQSYYTIGSAGHEGNAAVAAALRPTDPALLHYRSGAFFLMRAQQSGYPHGVRDIALGLVAARDEPIAGGRHKVFGSRILNIPPQTSTIASHLPRAVGLAVALERRRRLHLPAELPTDAIVVCSFGDASINHSTAVGALNNAAHLAHQQLPAPVLFVCEDNGIGISVPTPSGWIATRYRDNPGLAYFAGDGLDLVSAYDAACQAAEHVRRTRRPALLHLTTVRLLGHAGSDVELGYRSLDEIRAAEARDPLLASARLLAQHGVLPPAEIRDRYEAMRACVDAACDDAVRRPKLERATDVIWPLAPRAPEAIAREAQRPLDADARGRFWEQRLPEHDEPQPLAGHITRALGDLLVKYPQLLVFGEDVGKKGGVYGLTKGLQKRAGIARVFDTLLDEQAILGLGLGAGQAGLLPIPEIQYLAYLHNAEDQLRGEAATLQFFSQAQYRNPLVVRIAAYGYQKGFGGHFHNDNSVAVLRDIPGLVVASPARGDDAAAQLRTLTAAALVDGTVSVFLEPIALYHTRDLQDSGDGAWCTRYDPAGEHVPIGQARRYGDGNDLVLVSFANGVPMSLRVARRLKAYGIACTVLDLRWLQPLPYEALAACTRARAVLVVDETRRSGGVAEAVLTALLEAGGPARLGRVTSQDSFIPLGPAANLVLLSEDDIERAARALLR